MIPIPTLVVGISIKRIVSHQALIQDVVRARIVRIRSVGNFNRIIHPVPVGISLVRIRPA